MKVKIKKNHLLIGLFLIVILPSIFFLTRAGGEAEEVEPINEVSDNEAKEIIKDDLIIDRVEGVPIPEIEADAVYSFYYEKDGEKQVLFTKNRNKRLPIASITKLVTALVVHENYDLDSTIGISEQALFTDPLLYELRVFPDTTYGELLYPLLLESNNSSAYVAAVAPEDVEFDDFIEMMNSKAEEIDMRRTDFKNPSGLDNVRGVNLSTAQDVGKLTLRLLEIPIFWEIMRVTSYDIHSGSSNLYYRVETTNDFLNGNYFGAERPDWYDKILGGKTGYTGKAGGTLLMVLETESGYLINIILGAEAHRERFEEMEKLIDWIYKAYKIK